MPAKHLRAKPALEADDVILLDRASDRHRRPGWLLRGRDTPQTGKGAMHVDYQSRELVGGDLMMSHIAADDAHNLNRINQRRRAVFYHCILPVDDLGFFVELTLRSAVIPDGYFFNRPKFC